MSAFSLGKMSKYLSKKIVVNGRKFDSKKEANRYIELVLLERAGEISDLECQKKYVLIGEQREFSTEIYTKGKKKGCFKPGKLLEREVSYIADFDYWANGKHIVEDVKGYKNSTAYAVFVIKRKLMLKEFGIRVKEV